jgi:hypothetical protein
MITNIIVIAVCPASHKTINMFNLTKKPANGGRPAKESNATEKHTAAV